MAIPLVVGRTAAPFELSNAPTGRWSARAELQIVTAMLKGVSDTAEFIVSIVLKKRALATGKEGRSDTGTRLANTGSILPQYVENQ
jgi:hypothetical protein